MLDWNVSKSLANWQNLNQELKLLIVLNKQSLWLLYGVSCAEFKFDGFSTDLTRSMVAMEDVSFQTFTYLYSYYWLVFII